MDERLAGCRAIVTGGASGFGAGIARRFVAAGAEVIIADLNATSGEQLARELQCQFHRTDVTDTESVRALAKATQPVDILVNNAGIGLSPQPAHEVDETLFDRVLAVNMKSIFNTIQAFVPDMKTRRAGRIVNIASTAGVSPRPGLTWYNASKGWVITATRSLAVELAPFGIRVNAVNPVAGDTPMLGTFLGEDTPERRQAFVDTIPLGRLSTPEDVANAVLYLASDEASMVTGVALEVDGGRVI